MKNVKIMQLDFGQEISNFYCKYSAGMIKLYGKFILLMLKAYIITLQGRF